MRRSLLACLCTVFLVTACGGGGSVSVATEGVCEWPPQPSVDQIGEPLGYVDGMPFGTTEFDTMAARQVGRDGTLDVEVRGDIVDQLVDEKLLYMEARRRGIDKDPKIQKMMVNTLLKQEVYGAVRTAEIRESELRDYFEEHKGTSDYLVGWIDCFGKGKMLGRGLIHDARYLAPGEDERPMEETCALAHQELPASIMGVFPKSEMWEVLKYFVHDPGMRLINGAKYVSGLFEGNHRPTRQAHAAFAFLLDYVPNWKRAYGTGGLIQYQPFMPEETAHDVYSECLRWSHKKGIVPYLGVFKRHRPDPFLMTYCTGGWSMAMDFRVTPKNREELWQHCRELTEIVLEGGGRFYFAKDLVIGPKDAERMFPEAALQRFLELKRELDPEGLFVTDMWRRVFEPLARERGLAG